MLAFAADAGLAIPRRALFLAAEPHPAMRDWPDLTGWQSFKPTADAWDATGMPRVDELPDDTWPVVLVLPGRSRDETLSWFAMARDHLETGGSIIAAMPNTAGASRFEKELAKATGRVTSIQKHKCRAFHATHDGSWNEGVFEKWRSLGNRREIPGTKFVTQAGIFSCDHIDPGSRLLADHLPGHLRGVAADLGAGWGYLSDAALRRCPHIERLDLYEADARALACARRNLTDHDRNVAFHWHDVTTGLTEVCDAIIMNPPFHSGQATDIGLGLAFLKTAAASLRRGGQLFMVANRQLPYEAALTAAGLSWRKVAEDATYKLLFASKR